MKLNAQTDLGFAGSPCLNTQGQLVGIVSVSVGSTDWMPTAHVVRKVLYAARGQNNRNNK